MSRRPGSSPSCPPATGRTAPCRGRPVAGGQDGDDPGRLDISAAGCSHGGRLGDGTRVRCPGPGHRASLSRGPRALSGNEMVHAKSFGAEQAVVHAETLPTPPPERTNSDARAGGNKPMKHLLARLISKLGGVAGVVASVAIPAFAQDGTGPMPENAQPRSYGSGWVCDFGYRVEGAECLALDIPEHAYPTGRSYGTGWECDRGYEEVDGTSCNPILVPANAFLRSFGYDWKCERGYRQEHETCVQIVLPEYAYLTEDSLGTGWTCDRGYAAFTGTCIPIVVPTNAYLTNANYGAAWA